MEILNVRLARAIWLFEARDLNPKGLNLIPFAAEVRDRYKFLVWPNTPEALAPDNPQGSAFQNGAFAVDNQVLTVSFTLYGDGIVADTGASTQHTEAFIDDLLSFAQQAGLVYRPDLIQRKQYVSELIVRPHAAIVSLCGKLGSLAAMINRMVPPFEATYEWTGFQLGADHRYPFQPLAFTFERETKVPFDLNRFYSSAPLRTEQHEALLDEMEALLG